MILKEITDYFDSIVSIHLQESYDNSGIQLGNPENEIKGILVCLDVNEEIINEAVRLGTNLIVSHHPLIFNGIKKLAGQSFVERLVVKAIKQDINIYAMHTNIDNYKQGVNYEICKRLNIQKCKILQAKNGLLNKLVTFIPEKHAKEVSQAIFDAGAGNIGNYDSCSFNINGTGTFKGGEETNPFVGKKGALHYENEIRFETVFPKYITNKVIAALIEAHPYEEVAYDIYALENKFNNVGAGMIGELEKKTSELDFLKLIKQNFNVKSIRHSKLLNKEIKKVAVCGGSGSFLLSDAINQQADIFISADFKYHQFFDADDKILIADIGHFESEQFTKDLIYDLLIKKFPNFAVHLSKINTNPINYL